MNEFKDGPGDPEWEAQWRAPDSMDLSDHRPLRLASISDYLTSPMNPTRDPAIASALYLQSREEIAARNVAWYTANGDSLEVARKKWRGFREQFGLDADS